MTQGSKEVNKICVDSDQMPPQASQNFLTTWHLQAKVFSLYHQDENRK